MVFIENTEVLGVLRPEAEMLLENLEALGFQGCRVVECDPDLTGISLGVVTGNFEQLHPLAAIADALNLVELGGEDDWDLEVTIEYAGLVACAKLLWRIEIAGGDPSFLGSFNKLAQVFLDAARTVYLPCDECGEPVKIDIDRPLDLWAGEFAVKRCVIKHEASHAHIEPEEEVHIM